jgi:S-adenosylmethionine-diacylglycerol 3-amino-3-carboxypropyl transferase
MAAFFSRLSYSLGNEDWRTEQKALAIQPTDDICCITASGDRPLNLLTAYCQSITCVDANPIQNYLLELKKIAIQQLNYIDYLSFLGATPGKNRWVTLQKLLPFMEIQAAAFWAKQKGMIEKGVLYQGATERLTKVVSRFANLFRGRKIKKLFAYDDLDAQRRFVKEKWDNYFWRQLFKVILNPFISRFMLEDPGLANVGKTIQPGTYIYERLTASLNRDLAKRNLLLSLILKGEISSDAFSPYLTEQGFNIIKSQLNRLHGQTQGIVEYLESIDGPTFDVFSLSDVASYITHADFVRLLHAMLKTAKPGARFCMRQFLSAHDIPAELQPFFKRNTSLEQELEQQDNCFVYRFSVGTIESAKLVLEDIPATVMQPEFIEV